MANSDDLRALLKDIPNMNTRERDESDAVLEQLQHAVKEHEQILARQAALIERLRQELKDVKK